MATESLFDALRRLDRIEALLGHVRLDELPPKWREKVERAYAESRYDWAGDDPLRVAFLAHLPSGDEENVRSIFASHVTGEQ
jgi:hypothetical protein